jgi:hypothetical protein
VFGGDEESGGVIGITLNKMDVWDNRYDRRGQTYAPLEEMRRLIREKSGTPEGREELRQLEPYCLVAASDWHRGTYPYAYSPPTPKPLGLVRVDPGAAYETFESRLSIHRGEVSYMLGTAQRGANIEAWIDANRNALIVRLERHGAHERPIAVELSRYVDPDLGEPEIQVEGSTFWHRYVFPDGLSYVVFGVVDGQIEHSELGGGEWRDVEARNGWIREEPGYMRTWEEEIALPERHATLTLSPNAAAATVYLGVATSFEARDPLAHARELAETAARDAAQARAAHVAWWDQFWRKSSLTLSDRLVETAWYQGLYLLALQSRGSQPPCVVGGPGYYLPYAAWHGIYIIDFNIQMMYWPVFAANHLELADVCFDFWSRNLEVMREDTRTIWGLEGIKLPGVTIRSCRELGYLPCRNWQSASAWVAQLYWWRYKFAGDQEFLRESAYPLMREIARFCQAYALLGDDGKYHMWPSTAPEQSPWWATDPAIDMTLLRWFFQATIEASETLGRDEDLRPGWQDLLDRWPGLPTNGEVILDSRYAEPDSRLAHVGLLTCVWTAGEIGMGSPKEQHDLALRTLRGLFARASRKLKAYPHPIPTWNDDCNWTAIIAYAARLGLRDEFLAWLYDFGLLQHLKPNGVFAFDTTVTDHDREVRWGMPDSNHALTAAISEALLQSYEGFIRIFPTLPASWDSSFRGFLAMGAFEVDATAVGGEVTHVTIRSLKGNGCRVLNPWPGDAVAVERNGRRVPIEERDGIVEFDTEAGGEYTLARPGVDPAPLPDSLTSSGPAGPLSYSGPTYMADVPAGERTTVWTGMPAMS